MSTTIIPGPNVFRAISGSLFSTVGNWSRGYIPTGSDVAMIADNCVIDINRTIGSLIVQPGFTASINTGLTLQVNNAINSLGHINCVGSPSIIVNSKNNVINSLSASTSTFTYNSQNPQNLSGVNYYNLTLSGAGIKKISSGNISVSGSFIMNNTASLELNSANLNVSGSADVSFYFTPLSIKKSQYGNIVFNGLFYTTGTNTIVDFSAGNPDVELRNNFAISNTSITNFKSGQGTWSFTTRNQSIYLANGFVGSNIYFDSPILIKDGINLSLNTNGNPFDYLRLYVYLNNTVNATSGSSRLINSGSLTFTNLTSLNSMITGTLDLTFPSNVLEFGGNYTATIPSRFGNSFYNLNITGTGIKTLGTSSYVSGSLTVGSLSTTNPGILELSSSNLTVSGTVYITNSSTLQKSNSGSVTFYGLLSLPQTAQSIDFRVGNPTVECRGGISPGLNHSSNVIYTGTGSWNFTRNQTITSWNSGVTPLNLYQLNFDAPVIVSGSSIVTLTGFYIFSSSINGTEAASTFINAGKLYNMNTIFPMQTGSIDYLTNNNTMGFVGNNNAIVPSGSFRNLFISGSGQKTLSGSVYVSGSLTIETGILELNNNSITISGSTTFNGYNGGKLTKSGSSGYVLFNGGISLPAADNSIDFSVGNPTVEVRNGITAGLNNNPGVLNTGTGSWIFSNNQTITNWNNIFNINFSASVLISASVLTVGGIYSFFRPINGSDSNSKLKNNSTIYFATSQSLIDSFQTGSYDFTSSGNNIVIGGDYTATIPSKYSSSFYNLFISGQGTKSLAVDMYVSGNLRLESPAFNSPGIFDVSSSNLTVMGTTNTGFSAGSVLKKSGPGKITFVGKAIIGPTAIDFATGNSTFEFQNGIQSVSSGGDLNFGSGTCSFTTNTQIIDITTYGDQRATFKNILVSGSIVVTASSATYGWAYIHVKEGINGTTANSVFTSRTTAGVAPIIWYSGSQMPMQTGILEVSSSANTFIYASGSQDVKGGTYYNLTFLNGLKTLQGNVSVLGTFSTGSGATVGTINYNGFTLTNP